jgi:hypothetical protein
MERNPNAWIIIQKPGKELDLWGARGWVWDQRATPTAKGNGIAWTSLVKRYPIGA